MNLDEYIETVFEPARRSGSAFEQNGDLCGFITDPLRDQEAGEFLSEVDVAWSMEPWDVKNIDLESTAAENPRRSFNLEASEGYHRDMARGVFFFPSPHVEPGNCMVPNGEHRIRAAVGIIDFIWVVQFARNLTKSERSVLYARTNQINGVRYKTDDKYVVCANLHRYAKMSVKDAAIQAGIPGQGNAAIIADRLVRAYPWMIDRTNGNIGRRSRSTISRVAASIRARGPEALPEPDWRWVMDNAGRLTHGEGLNYQSIPKSYTSSQSVAFLKEKLDRERGGKQPVRTALDQAEWWTKLSVQGAKDVYQAMSPKDRQRFERAIRIQARGAGLKIAVKEEV